ncbi:hypothetical protein [Thalassospira sp. MCCC 1A01428]|uniref:hypothetical protein n=1 Tax=Thalassospira sp. MCCC 1A01428 TaxID=1470575 RepID=UPI000A1EE53E|nr:hypothetical protein [Thalassospira sp. MCCC 1A01428]OSQ34292.1 hypothetical protein THS27_25640 [Thalassospira sp. MCCC 1A01428]
MNIEQTIHQELAKALTPENVARIAAPKIDSMISDCISELFDWRGELRKEIKEKLKQEIGLDLSEISFSEYNADILAAIKQHVTLEQDKHIAALAEQATKALADATPDKITLSEILNDWINENNEDGTDPDFIEESDFLSVRHSRSDLDPTTSFSAHLKTPESHGDEVYIHVYKGKLLSVKTRHLGSTPKSTKEVCFQISIFNVERRLFQMYAHGTEITNDLDL